MDHSWLQLFITVGAMVFLSGATIAALKVQAEGTTRRLAEIEEEMKKMQQVLINQATQAVRLDTMDQRLSSQGARLDAALESHNKGLQSMARMVEATVSRVNNLIDEEHKKLKSLFKTENGGN
jgi:septal ring factor EnvC (AmiA/AmiB activator)